MGEAARVLPAPFTTDRPDDRAPLSLADRVALVRPPCFWPALPGKKPLSAIERAGLIRLADSIPGDCADETMLALMEAMRHAPAGDVVQIGAGAGRASALLAWLAGRYETGAVLCLDDWRDEQLAAFQIALAPLAEGRLNYRRDRAAVGYGPGLTVSSETFGETHYEGRIAFLHLVGRADAAAGWVDHLAPGGWVVFGGMPRTDAEAFVAARRERICAKFAADDALFVQLKR